MGRTACEDDKEQMPVPRQRLPRPEGAGCIARGRLHPARLAVATGTTTRKDIGNSNGNNDKDKDGDEDGNENKDKVATKMTTR